MTCTWRTRRSQDPSPYKGRLDSPEIYRELVQGDFPKQVTMKFLRDLDADQIQEDVKKALVSRAAELIK